MFIKQKSCFFLSLQKCLCRLGLTTEDGFLHQTLFVPRIIWYDWIGWILDASQTRTFECMQKQLEVYQHALVINTIVQVISFYLFREVLAITSRYQFRSAWIHYSWMQVYTYLGLICYMLIQILQSMDRCYCLYILLVSHRLGLNRIIRVTHGIL
jgi:hypothetical protein